jgi:hypothetical protein
MNTEHIKKLEKTIQSMKDKQSRIYFVVQDTKGNAKGSVRYTYQMAHTLKKNGYNSIILHETKDYFGVADWLGEEYMNELPHKSIDEGNLEISPDDILIIPEIFGYIMDQVKNLPCGKIVLTQAYDHIFETLEPGQTWSQLGFHKCITTSNTQKEHIETLMRKISYEVINPVISDVFKKPEYPAKTIIGIHARDQRDTVNIVKQFYARFPQYRWVRLLDLRGLTEAEFANAMKDSFLSVWVDQTSGFGTFPLESMKMGIPVIGMLPHLQPEWLNEDNGLWLANKNTLVDVVADFVQNWLEDNINPELYSAMEKTAGEYSDMEKFESTVLSVFSEMFETRMKSFEEQLNKLETIEE